MLNEMDREAETLCTVLHMVQHFKMKVRVNKAQALLSSFLRMCLAVKHIIQEVRFRLT